MQLKGNYCEWNWKPPPYLPYLFLHIVTWRDARYFTVFLETKCLASHMDWIHFIYAIRYRIHIDCNYGWIETKPADVGNMVFGRSSRELGWRVSGYSEWEKAHCKCIKCRTLNQLNSDLLTQKTIANMQIIEPNLSLH